jgi:uncharacterized damage-inducible protein DinB
MTPAKSARKAKNSATTKAFLAEAQRTLSQEYLPRIEKCLAQLSEDEIWWRPNPPSNSIGNLVLHLCGNVRQWIISGLGGADDVRERDLEFSEQGPVPREELVAQLRRTVREACRVLSGLSEDSLLRKHSIQGYHATGVYAVLHVTEHFGYHAGQIIYITKLKRAEDLKFTHLPAIKKKGKAGAAAKAQSA